MPTPTGPYIKHFLDAIGHVGLNNLLAAYPDKSAHAQAIFAFTLGPTHEPMVFVGRTPGQVHPSSLSYGCLTRPECAGPGPACHGEEVDSGAGLRVGAWL